MASMKPKKSSLPPPKPRQRVAVGAPTRSIDTRLVVGIVVAAAVVLGIVVALVVGGGGDDDDATTAGTVPGVECTIEPGDDGAGGPDVTVGDFVDGEIPQPVAVSGDPLALFSREGADPALCTRAPVVLGYDYEGNPVTIDAAADGPTLVVLLAHWCPHCNAEIPRLNEWRDAGDVPEGLNVVGVSTGVSADRANYPPDEWLVDMDWQWSVLADSAEMTAFDAYGAASFPTMIVIGSDGLVRGRVSGEMSVDQVDQFVRSALSQDSGLG